LSKFILVKKEFTKVTWPWSI